MEIMIARYVDPHIIYKAAKAASTNNFEGGLLMVVFSILLGNQCSMLKGALKFHANFRYIFQINPGAMTGCCTIVSEAAGMTAF
jgi:hypothetical protein